MTQILILTLLPVSLSYELWQKIWSGVRPSAWDGSGHFALAQIYSDTIFPDVFGWTNAFFGGMPHPNNYPPLFYWLIGLLTHSHLFSFLTSFKMVLVVPTLLLPAATWFLAWKVSDKNQGIALCSALAITPLLVDYRFFTSAGPLGISYISTFLTGLYSHPLGYLFLIWWYAVYSDRRQPLWRIAVSSLLLAGAALSNFFGVSFAGVFVIVTLIDDLRRLFSSKETKHYRQARQSLTGHFISPVIAFCLTLFWLAPVFATREYLITQPSSFALGELLSPALLIWYLLAGAGFILWLLRRRQSAGLGVYLVSCFALAVIIFLSGVIAPPWFPMNTGRMLTTLNFLLAVPVGLTAAFAFGKLFELLGVPLLFSQISEGFARHLNQPKDRTASPEALSQSSNNNLKPWQMIGIILGLIFVVIVIGKGIKPASFELAFYQTANREAIDPLLEYARDHKDGRYLVEIPPFTDVVAGHEGRAINNFLPMQGNEVLTVFFREASPEIVFFSPVVDRFSVQADPSGISSVLSDDLDFAGQPAALHLQQAQLMGVRYLVIRSPWARNLLRGQPAVKSRRDFGLWSVYELGGDSARPVQVLAYKPALAVSDLNLKGRRHNAPDFVRLVEEQIYSGWFDVRLARSSESELDKLVVEDGFGALIVDTYNFSDERAAFERLREFAQHRRLILLESDNALFRHVQSAISDFPQATIINRMPEEPGEWLKSGAPSRSYETSQIRQTWKQIQSILDAGKVSVSPDSGLITASGVERNKIVIRPAAPSGEALPVLINTTFHPNWQRADGAAVYPVTPFFMLTFVREPTELNFARRSSDRIGVILSAITFLLLLGSLLWHYGGLFSGKARQKSQDEMTVPDIIEAADD